MVAASHDRTAKPTDAPPREQRVRRVGWDPRKRPVAVKFKRFVEGVRFSASAKVGLNADPSIIVFTHTNHGSDT